MLPYVLRLGHRHLQISQIVSVLLTNHLKESVQRVPIVGTQESKSVPLIKDASGLTGDLSIATEETQGQVIGEADIDLHCFLGNQLYAFGKL